MGTVDIANDNLGSLKEIVRKHGWSMVNGVISPPPLKPIHRKPLSKAQIRVLQSASKNNGTYDTRDSRPAFILVNLGLLKHEGASHIMSCAASFRLTEAGLALAASLANSKEYQNSAGVMLG